MNRRLANAPPTMVKLDKATAYFAGKPAGKQRRCLQAISSYISNMKAQEKSSNATM